MLFFNKYSKPQDKMSTVASALSIKGERRTGQDVRTQNVMAASSIANIVKVRKFR